MLQCPKCERTFKDAAFSGWLVFGRGYASVDREGQIQIVGPIVPMVSVEPGRKLLEADVQITCPHCNTDSHAREYQLIRPCDFTGGNAKVPVVLFTGDQVVVAEDAVEWVRAKLTNTPEFMNDRGEPLALALRRVAQAYVGR